MLKAVWDETRRADAPCVAKASYRSGRKKILFPVDDTGRNNRTGEPSPPMPGGGEGFRFLDIIYVGRAFAPCPVAARSQERWFLRSFLRSFLRQAKGRPRPLLVFVNISSPKISLADM
jgi:hypothetical protein